MVKKNEYKNDVSGISDAKEKTINHVCHITRTMCCYAARHAFEQQDVGLRENCGL